MREHQLKGEFIELIKLLKYTGLASSGGEAKAMVEEGIVLLNGDVEHRKRAKIKRGDIIEFNGEMIKVI